MEKLRNRWAKGLYVCGGLDPVHSKIPDHIRDANKGDWCDSVLEYLLAIAQEAKDEVAIFKPNLKFFLRPGNEGILALDILVNQLHQIAPEVPVLLDAKENDIGNTVWAAGLGYFGPHEQAPEQPTKDIEAFFKGLDLDGVTVNPYMGQEAISPLFQYAGKGIAVLVRTSNKGAAEFQDLPVAVEPEKFKELVNGPAGSCGQDVEFETFVRSSRLVTVGHPVMPLYQYVALRVANHWNTEGNCLAVVGATSAKEAAQIRKLVPKLPFLVPGVGAQGGDLEGVVRAVRIDGEEGGFVINVSRAFLQTSNGRDFAKAGARYAHELNAQINEYRLAK